MTVLHLLLGVFMTGFGFVLVQSRTARAALFRPNRLTRQPPSTVAYLVLGLIFVLVGITQILEAIP